MQMKRNRFMTGVYLFAVLAVAAAAIWSSSVTSLLFAKPATNSATATYVTTAEIDAALQQMPPNSTTYDKPIKTVDAGAYKVTIVILRRVPGKTPDSSLLHDRVTEVYQILTGAGMFETGGTLVDGKTVDLTSEAAGPSIRGTIQGGDSRRMGPGDVVVIPPGVPHRFSKLEGTITYSEIAAEFIPTVSQQLSRRAEAMRKHWILGNLFLSIVTLVSTSLFAQDEAPPNPPQQGGTAPRQMRGPAPPVPGPPHDPHDLTGVWNGRRGYGGSTFGRQGPEMTEWGKQQFKTAKASNGGEYTLKETNDPILTKCLPPGTPRIYLQPVPMQVIHTPKAVLLYYEYDHIVRYVFTDGRKHPEDLTPTYMGHSIGRWDGDIFVVDTVGFNEKTWLDRIGHTHSDQLHVIERFHRLDQNNLELDITMGDAKALAKPWDVHFGFSLHADWDILEQACPDNAGFVDFEK